MSSQRVQKGAGGGIPEFDVVVKRRRCDEGSGGGEDDVVDLFLVAEEAGDGFLSGGWGPKVDGKVVGC